MKRYKIVIINKYSFTLEGENKKDINYQINTILNDSKILDLPCVRKSTKTKVKEMRNKNETYC